MNDETGVLSSPCGDGMTTPKYPVMDDAFPSPRGAAPLYHGGGTIEIPFQGEP